MVNTKIMKALSSLFFISHLLLPSFYSFSLALSDAEATYIARHQLLTLPRDGELPSDDEYKVDARITFANTRLKRAYIALQAWKKAIYSDPQNMTANWVGPNVCAYRGVFCAQALDDPDMTVVAGIDLNHADIAGHLPMEIGFLTDISLLHMNSNRFCGIVPPSVSKLNLLTELDLSNNRFVGPFPNVILELPEIKYLDLRYNEFEGPLPPELFEKELDALFLNNNRFRSTIPESIGDSTVSVMVLANNKFSGCIPEGIGRMPYLEELILVNNGFSGCFPEGITMLKNLQLLDLSGNNFVGSLPTSLGKLENLVEFEIANNGLKGVVPKQVCSLPHLQKLTLSGNYFESKDRACDDVQSEDTDNCFIGMPNQKSNESCSTALKQQIDCSSMGCGYSKHSKPTESNPESKSTLSPPIPKSIPPNISPKSSLPFDRTQPLSQIIKTRPPSRPTQVSTSSIHSPLKPSPTPPQPYPPSIAEPPSWIPAYVSNNDLTPTPAPIFTPSSPSPPLAFSQPPSLAPTSSTDSLEKSLPPLSSSTPRPSLIAKPPSWTPGYKLNDYSAPSPSPIFKPIRPV